MILQDTFPGQTILLSVNKNGMPTSRLTNTTKFVECFVCAKKIAGETLCLWRSDDGLIVGNKRPNNADLVEYVRRNYEKYCPLIPSDTKYDSLGWFMGQRLCKPRIYHADQSCTICGIPAPHSEPNINNTYACSFCLVAKSL